MPNSLLLDACIAINLLAADCSEDIATALDIRFLMAAQAATECGELHVIKDQVLVRRHGATSDTSPLAQVLTLNESETNTYVELAKDIDDGEAATIAIARSRSLTMATDDRKACRVAVEVGLDAPKGTTTILRQYAEVVGLAPRKIAVVLQRIQDEASYIPRHTDQNFSWWQQNIDP